MLGSPGRYASKAFLAPGSFYVVRTGRGEEGQEPHRGNQQRQTGDVRDHRLLDDAGPTLGLGLSLSDWLAGLSIP